MAAFAYYKNYFDRVTADLDFEFNQEPKPKSPTTRRSIRKELSSNFIPALMGSESVIKMAA